MGNQTSNERKLLNEVEETLKKQAETLKKLWQQDICESNAAVVPTSSAPPNQNYLTLQALRIVLRENESIVFDENARLKEQAETSTKQLKLWQGDVVIPTESDCWRAFRTSQDLEYYGWGCDAGPPVMKFIGTVEKYATYSYHWRDGVVERLQEDGPFYVFRMPFNIKEDNFKFKDSKGDPVLIHLQTHELHLLWNPMYEEDEEEMVMNLDGEHPHEQLWFRRYKYWEEYDY